MRYQDPHARLPGRGDGIPPDNALQPTIGHVTVDRLGVYTLTLEPRRVGHKARRDFIEKRF